MGTLGRSQSEGKVNSAQRNKTLLSCFSCLGDKCGAYYVVSVSVVSPGCEYCVVLDLGVNNDSCTSWVSILSVVFVVSILSVVFPGCQY